MLKDVDFNMEKLISIFHNMKNEYHNPTNFIANADALIQALRNFTPLGAEPRLREFLTTLTCHDSIAHVTCVRMAAHHAGIISWCGAPTNVSALADAVGLTVTDVMTRKPNLEESYLALVEQS